MMKEISIKTVDGSRFDTTSDGVTQKTAEEMILEAAKSGAHFLQFFVDGGNKYFNIQNIVSITEKEIDDA